jgi:hypothetical protein
MQFSKLKKLILYFLGTGVFAFLLLFQNCSLSKSRNSSESSGAGVTTHKNFSGGNGSGYDGKPFANSSETCSDGSVISSRILVTTSSAFMVRNHCQDMPLTEIPRENLDADSANENAFSYEGVNFAFERPPLQIQPLSHFYTQFSGVLNNAIPAEVYVVDIEADPANILQLKTAGKKVICTFSAGIVDDSDPDYSQFSAATKGNGTGLTGEYFVDINSTAVRILMLKRLDSLRTLNCDGVNITDLDSYLEDTGFSFTEEMQVEYNAVLSYAAHDRNLVSGFKSVPTILARLINAFDFVESTQCFSQAACQIFAAFTGVGKPAFVSEFVPLTPAMCALAKDLNISLAQQPPLFDGSVYATCPD